MKDWHRINKYSENVKTSTVVNSKKKHLGHLTYACFEYPLKTRNQNLKCTFQNSHFFWGSCILLVRQWIFSTVLKKILGKNKDFFCCKVLYCERCHKPEQSQFQPLMLNPYLQTQLISRKIGHPKLLHLIQRTKKQKDMVQCIIIV